MELKGISDLRVYEDRISVLSEDLLVHILLFVSTKLGVTTAVLSKRWRSIWKLLPTLEYNVTNDRGDERVWSYVDQSLQLHKATVLKSLVIKVGSKSPIDVDIGKWIDKAVESRIQLLTLDLVLSPERTSLSRSLYTCKTLKDLTLSNKILVDVPLQASLPLLRKLNLFNVVYKDEESLVRLLSSCPLLEYLCVFRNDEDFDNVTIFSIKVPSLQSLCYRNYGVDDLSSLVIDSPRLKYLEIMDGPGDICLIENMPPRPFMSILDVVSQPNDKFMRCISSVMYLDLMWNNDVDVFLGAIHSALHFSWLIECKLRPEHCESWVISVMLLLSNSPNLRVLMITSESIDEDSVELLLWWNSPSFVPKCLSYSLEIFEWEGYRGTRTEKQVLGYIFAHSKCLKTVGVSPKSANNIEETEEIMVEEIKSMHRLSSSSSQLIFSTQFNWRSIRRHPDYHYFQ